MLECNSEWRESRKTGLKIFLFSSFNQLIESEEPAFVKRLVLLIISIAKFGTSAAQLS